MQRRGSTWCIEDYWFLKKCSGISWLNEMQDQPLNLLFFTLEIPVLCTDSALAGDSQSKREHKWLWRPWSSQYVWKSDFSSIGISLFDCAGREDMLWRRTTDLDFFLRQVDWGGFRLLQEVLSRSLYQWLLWISWADWKLICSPKYHGDFWSMDYVLRAWVQEVPYPF